MTIRFPISNERHAKVAFLKVAYLLGFLRLGYSYILSTNLDDVRKQIQDPSAEVLPVFDLVVGPVPAMALQKNSIALISAPAELDGFMAMFEIVGIGHFGVLLPHSRSTPGFFDRASQHKQLHKMLNVTLTGLRANAP